jgi:hypothetical protein
MQLVVSDCWIPGSREEQQCAAAAEKQQYGATTIEILHNI